jgi:hypothetical protein
MVSDEAPFYVVRDANGVIPDEHYCAAHLIGEAGYLAKHGLTDSADVWIDHEDEGTCDEPGCPHFAPPSEVGLSGGGTTGDPA